MKTGLLIKILIIFTFLNILITYAMITSTHNENIQIKEEAENFVEKLCDMEKVDIWKKDFKRWDNETKFNFTIE